MEPPGADQCPYSCHDMSLGRAKSCHGSRRVTVHHGASRRFAERHRAHVTTCHDASRFVMAVATRLSLDVSRSGTTCHDVSWFVMTRGDDASRCVMVRLDASCSGIVHASRRVTTRRDAPRPVTTRLRLDVSQDVATTRQATAWFVTTRRNTSMGRRRVATGHDASRCLMVRHDAARSGIVHASRRVATRRDASRPVTTRLRLDVSQSVTTCTRHGLS